MSAKQVKQGYVSDFTRFIAGFIDGHPEVVDEQRQGRAIFWDRPVDFRRLREEEEDRVPVDSYYYYGNPWPRNGRQ